MMTKVTVGRVSKFVDLSAKETQELRALTNSYYIGSYMRDMLNLHKIKEKDEYALVRIKNDLVARARNSNGKVIAWSQLHKHTYANTGLISVFVHKDMRKQGIGTALVKRMMSYVRRHNLVVHVNAEPWNDAGSKLYSKVRTLDKRAPLRITRY